VLWLCTAPPNPPPNTLSIHTWERAVHDTTFSCPCAARLSPFPPTGRTGAPSAIRPAHATLPTPCGRRWWDNHKCHSGHQKGEGVAEPQASANDAPGAPIPCTVRIPTIAITHHSMCSSRLWAPATTPSPTDLMPAVTLVLFSRHHTLSSGTQCGHKTDPSAHLCQADGSPVLPGGGNSHGAHEAESLVRGPHASQEWTSVLTPTNSTVYEYMDVPLEINIQTKKWREKTLYW
jgi:hypothetical protein